MARQLAALQKRLRLPCLHRQAEWSLNNLPTKHEGYGAPGGPPFICLFHQRRSQCWECWYNIHHTYIQRATVHSDNSHATRSDPHGNEMSDTFSRSKNPQGKQNPQRKRDIIRYPSWWYELCVAVHIGNFIITTALRQYNIGTQAFPSRPKMQDSEQ